MPFFGSVTTAIPVATKTVAFTGAAGLGAQGSVSCFTVTGGLVLVHIIAARCTEDLVSAGGGTLALGTTNHVAQFIAATTATGIDNGEIWTTTSPSTGAADTPDIMGNVQIDEDIILTVATGDITDGTIVLSVLWEPLTPGATLVAA